MPETAQLEIELRRHGLESFFVDLRYVSGKGGDTYLRPPKIGHAKIDFAKLRENELDYEAYGKQLWKHIFLETGIKETLDKALLDAQKDNEVLRVKLIMGNDVPDLHLLRWELLKDLDHAPFISQNENFLFSRYLRGYGFKNYHRAAKGKLRALLAVASPDDLDTYQLTPIDVNAEQARASAALDGISTTNLPDGDKRVTVDNLMDCLREEPEYDILYLVCHGSMKDGETWLWLEDGAGKVSRVAGEDFATRLEELRKAPSVIVLACCEGAGKSGEPIVADDGSLAALGPRLSASGIPVVLAMQGKVAIATAGDFMAEFFRQLADHGDVDLAATRARGRLRDRSDWWMPVLFSRLISGQLWYEPKFQESDRLKVWPALVSHIKAGRCTPILGPGLVEPLVGSRHEIAQSMAEAWNYPLSLDSRESLPQVSQYLASTQDLLFSREQMLAFMETRLREQHARDLEGSSQDASLNELISVLGKKRRAENPHDPHKVLAAQNISIYLTTNFSDLLFDALLDEGKKPQMDICPWNNEKLGLKRLSERVPDYEPDEEHPLVYHLFGHLSEPGSLVITEDHYFDYLVGLTNNVGDIPSSVKARLVKSALLILGYEPNSWDLRVLLRSSIIRQPGSTSDNNIIGVAAQVDPQEGQIAEPEGARGYLQDYFGSQNVKIYWGDADTFIDDLVEHLEQGR